MEINIMFEKVAETTSTNEYLNQKCQEGKADEFHTVIADRQTAGKGQRGNTWESEPGKNLTFSTVLYPTALEAGKHFMLSVLAASSVLGAMNQYASGFSIKWPNDIYWNDRKIGGILIENELEGKYINRSIIGVGLNLNQREFHSDAPNPVSLCQIVGTEVNRMEILEAIIRRLVTHYHFLEREDPEGTASLRYFYRSNLYRRTGFYPYRDAQGTFMAEFQKIGPEGHLYLRDTEGRERRYAFKEVTFILPHE